MVTVLTSFMPSQLASSEALAATFARGAQAATPVCVAVFGATLKAHGIQDDHFATAMDRYYASFEKEDLIGQRNSLKSIADWILANKGAVRNILGDLAANFIGSSRFKPSQNQKFSAKPVDRTEKRNPARRDSPKMRVLAAVDTLPDPDRRVRTKIIRAIKESTPSLSHDDRLNLGVYVVNRLRARRDQNGRIYSGEADLLPEIASALDPMRLHTLSQTLRSTFRDPTPEVHLAVILAMRTSLSCFEADDQAQLLKEIEAQLTNENHFVRAGAVDLLANNLHLSDDPLKTALAIEAMLKDPHKVVRSTAARKLVEITAKLVYENRVMLAQALLTRAANQEEDGIVRTTATVILKDINPHLRMRA